MTNYERLQRNEGVALLVATIIMVVAVITLGALSLRAVNQSRQVQQHIVFKRAIEGVEAALAEVQVAVESGEDGLVGLSSAPTVSDGALQMPDFDDESVNPVQMAHMPDVEYFGFAQDWSSDGIDNNGDGGAQAIDGPDEAGFFTLYGFARCGDVTRSAEVVIEGSDVNVWNNAIFAGSGQAGGAIQGNCSVHGSVHILGDFVPVGGEAIIVLELIGASLVHNHYGVGAGPGPVLPDYLRDRVPTPPSTTFNGETVESLAAKLRVKNGLVSLSGSSEIGQADQFGNGVKDTMDGVYVTEGWTGNSVTDDGDRGDPTVVFSDNGWDETYDLGDKVSMPMLSDDWRWPDPTAIRCHDYAGIPGNAGTTETSPDGDNYGHAEFFSDQLADNAPYVGDIVIDTGNDFYLNLTTGETDPALFDYAAVQPADPTDCTSTGDDYIYFNKTTNVLYVNGQIEVDGSFEMTGKANDKTIYYTGRGAILAHGDITLDTDLLTCNNGNPADYNNSYPENCLGFMTYQNMSMGSNAQLDLMGAFYAEGTIKSTKQTVVMGTFVANYFDMGSQVPDIYQVPELAKNLPFGMIGNWPLWTFAQVSWRER